MDLPFTGWQRSFQTIWHCDVSKTSTTTTNPHPDEVGLGVQKLVINWRARTSPLRVAISSKLAKIDKLPGRAALRSTCQTEPNDLHIATVGSGRETMDCGGGAHYHVPFRDIDR